MCFSSVSSRKFRFRVSWFILTSFISFSSFSNLDWKTNGAYYLYDNSSAYLSKQSACWFKIYRNTYHLWPVFCKIFVSRLVTKKGHQDKKNLGAICKIFFNASNFTEKNFHKPFLTEKNEKWSSLFPTRTHATFFDKQTKKTVITKAINIISCMQTS